MRFINSDSLENGKTRAKQCICANKYICRMMDRYRMVGETRIYCTIHITSTSKQVILKQTVL